MAGSAWVERRLTPGGNLRYRVRFTLGGSGARKRFGGSFKTTREALLRRQWLAGELAALRVPDLRLLAAEPPQVPTLREAAESWRSSRIDVDEGTRTNDRVNTERIFKHDPGLADLRLDALGPERWARVFADLAEAGYRKGTLKKSREAFSMLYDHHAIDPNPVRDKRVKLPHERKRDLIVPLAGHVEAVARVLPRHHLLPYLVIDWTAVRVGALEEAKVRDLDEHRQAFLARLSVAKNERPVWLALHDVLFEALLAQLPPREDRDLDASLFRGFVGANLRTAITRACKATGTPHFYPHGLRKRRGSLLAKQGYTLAEIAERLGDTKVVTAEHYQYALGDYTEVDYAATLER
jgi:integrase